MSGKRIVKAFTFGDYPGDPVSEVFINADCVEHFGIEELEWSSVLLEEGYKGYVFFRSYAEDKKMVFIPFVYHEDGKRILDEFTKWFTASPCDFQTLSEYRIFEPPKLNERPTIEIHHSDNVSVTEIYSHCVDLRGNEPRIIPPRIQRKRKDEAKNLANKAK